MEPDDTTSELTVGVAIITFNGLKYLPQQLASIVAQTRRVDHIVVSDDRSTDGTWDYLQQWARTAPTRVTLLRNEPQLGLTANFEQSIGALDTDLIFTSDQDDVWAQDKVARLAAVFESSARVMLVHTDATLVDAQGRDLGTTLLGELALTPAERSAIHAGDAFAVYARRNVVTGATVAVRRSLVQLARPLPSGFFHDGWLALMAAATGHVRLLDVPTIDYRQHGNNLVGVKKLGRLAALRHVFWQMRGAEQRRLEVSNNLASRQTLHQRLRAHGGSSEQALQFAAGAIAFYEGRAGLPARPLPRVLRVLRTMSAGHYRKFSYAPWTDVMRDIANR